MKKIVAAVALAVSMPLMAHPLTTEECVIFAADSYATSIEMMQGKTLEDELALIQPGIEMCHQKFKDGCIFKDKEDTDRAIANVNWIWDTARYAFPPVMIAEQTRKLCQLASPDRAAYEEKHPEAKDDRKYEQ